MGWVTRKDIDDIKKYGVKVIEQPNWMIKSDNAFDIKGGMLHHDAMALGLVNTDPSDDFNVPAYMGTPGNLGSQFWASTRGEVVIMAAGGKGHAGTGQWGSIPANRGNTFCFAVETDHTDGTGWSDPLMWAIDVIFHVMIVNHGIDIDTWICGHKEYAPTRKHDPEAYSMPQMRLRQKAYLKDDSDLYKGVVIPPTTAPPIERDEDMAFSVVQIDGKPAFFAVNTQNGRMEGITSLEEYNIGLSHGIYKTVRVVNQREFDVLHAIALDLAQSRELVEAEPPKG